MTAAGDIAPGIQYTAILDGDTTALLHLDIAVCTGGVAVFCLRTGVMLGTHADCTINGY